MGNEKNNNEYMSYEQILKLEPIVLASYLEQKKIPVNVMVTNQIEAEIADKLARAIADNLSFLNSLLSYATALKRIAARKGKTFEYEDAVDREQIIKNAIRGCDTQYKAISKSISLYMDSLNKEKGILKRQ